MNFIFIIGAAGLSVLILLVAKFTNSTRNSNHTVASNMEPTSLQGKKTINDTQDNNESADDFSDVNIQSDRYIYERIKLANELAPIYTQHLCDNYERCFSVAESHKPNVFFCNIYYAFSILLALQSCYENIYQFCRFDPFDEYTKLSASLDEIINGFLVDSFEREKTKLDSLKTVKGKRNNYNKFVEEMDSAFVEAKQPYVVKDLPKYTEQIITINNIAVYKKLKIELQKQLPLLPDELEEIRRYVRSKFSDFDDHGEHDCSADSAQLKVQFEYEKEKLKKEREAGYSDGISIYLSFEDTILNQAIKNIDSRCSAACHSMEQSEVSQFFEWLKKTYGVSDDDIFGWKKHLKSEVNDKIFSDNLIKAMELEKSSDPADLTEAIKYYEENVQAGFTGTMPYDRLMVIYRRNKDYTNEQRIICSALSVFEKNDQMSDTLAKWKNRLEKSEKLQAKEQKVATES